MSAAFFDSNIIGYAADSHSDSTEKSMISRRLLTERTVVVSTQVMMESYRVLRAKLGYTPDSALGWVRTLKTKRVVEISGDDVIQGIDTALRFQLQHWDGLIIRAAQKSGVAILYSEDMNHGQSYGSIRVCNPFKEDFLAFQ